MDFTLTPELKQLQSRVRALVDDVLQPLELEAEQATDGCRPRLTPGSSRRCSTPA